jgi:hypothetical protein
MVSKNEIGSEISCFLKKAVRRAPSVCFYLYSFRFLIDKGLLLCEKAAKGVHDITETPYMLPLLSKDSRELSYLLA